MIQTSSTDKRTSFDAFHADFKEKIKQVYQHIDYTDTSKRGVPAIVIDEIMSLHPLSVVIPAEYGGMGHGIRENLMITSSAAYESLAFSLTLGINSALFLQPVVKYAKHEIKQKVFKSFTHDTKMGGLMITEPGFGSDALNMQTVFAKSDEHYHLKGIKHWAGLTSYAQYFLLTAREQLPSGQVKRDIDFFICDRSQPNQQIIIEEMFDNLGLHHIPYGRNNIDVTIPAVQRLEPLSSGINLMLDLLHRSRLQFPAMALGFIHRMMDEAIAHCTQRFVGGKSLMHYDQVQYRIARMQMSYTLCSAMIVYSCEHAGIENDLTGCGFEANAFKTIVTDLMQDAAQSLVQLVGAKAYRYSHIGGRGITDSRPFQIFEGSNDMLYAQIAEYVIKAMKQQKEPNLYQFLKTMKHAENAAFYTKEQLNIDLNIQLSQRKLVELGQILSRVVGIEMIGRLAEKGFNSELIENAISMLQAEITGIVSSFHHIESSMVIEDYQTDSSWYLLSKQKK